MPKAVKVHCQRTGGTAGAGAGTGAGGGADAGAGGGVGVVVWCGVVWLRVLLDPHPIGPTQQTIQRRGT
jgi:hypothetical protein